MTVVKSIGQCFAEDAFLADQFIAKPPQPRLQELGDPAFVLEKPIIFRLIARIGAFGKCLRYNPALPGPPRRDRSVPAPGQGSWTVSCFSHRHGCYGLVTGGTLSLPDRERHFSFVSGKRPEPRIGASHPAQGMRIAARYPGAAQRVRQALGLMDQGSGCDTACHLDRRRPQKADAGCPAVQGCCRMPGTDGPR